MPFQTAHEMPIFTPEQKHYFQPATSLQYLGGHGASDSKKHIHVTKKIITSDTSVFFSTSKTELDLLML